MRDIQQRVDKNEDVEGEYLTYILSNTEMSLKDVYASITELLLAGVDTVNFMLHNCLIHISDMEHVASSLHDRALSRIWVSSLLLLCQLLSLIENIWYIYFHLCVLYSYFVRVKTSNTLTWALYELSVNPHTQDKLYEEVSSLVPADQTPTAAQLTHMPYLRAVIRETLRWDCFMEHKADRSVFKAELGPEKSFLLLQDVPRGSH